MEKFWDQFREVTKKYPAGPRVGDIPTNLEYTRALKRSLEAAGLSPDQVKKSLKEAIHQRVKYGLLGGMNVPLKFGKNGVPKIPGRIYGVYRDYKP